MDRLKPNDYVVHFKREVSDLSKDKFSYTYKILSFATHSETKEKYVVYQALYTDESKNIHKNDIFIRPYDMFMSEVDHKKYPNIKQKYRFEKFENSCFECKGFYWKKYCSLDFRKDLKHCEVPSVLTCSKFIK